MICKSEREGFQVINHEAQLCVIGGGLAGMCAAISAARKGTTVVLMHDRPVLGGNASSEIRMWIRGAGGENVRETGLIEEIALENIYRNPDMNYSIWDSVLWEKVMLEENITLLLNCSCLDAEMQENRICTVTGWQTTTQQYHKVRAKIFADCSGDSVLAPLTGAVYRVGREAESEFDEDIAPEVGDAKTMGLSCLMQARETGRKVTFTAPKWAYRYTKEDFPHRINFSTPTKWTNDNFWWMEIGGTRDTIHDTEVLRDELIKIAYGVWDFIKNSGEVEADNWDLEWMGFLPGKRESRRYVGDYILRQNDLRSGAVFEDIIAYGGWTMDDHDPAGFETRSAPTKWNPVHSPYGIPYRCIYSCNVENLMFAGRNISVTHSANSSTRVMATCGMLGHALGTAAHIAVREKIAPREVGGRYLQELQQSLMNDDNYLPGKKRIVSSVMKEACIKAEGADPSLLTDGVERTVEEQEHLWTGELKKPIDVELPNAVSVSQIRLVLDSDLNRSTWEDQKWYIKMYPAVCNRFLDDRPVRVPETLLKTYEVYVDAGDGEWTLLVREENNYQRLVFIPVEGKVKRIRLVPTATWGTEKARIYSLELQE